jgi:methylenetetrahydrofolate dehydrogenase (NADP+)/methenyltetrahydrofolate cyclohydrolase
LLEPAIVLGVDDPKLFKEGLNDLFELADDTVDAILVQLPVPDHISEDKVIRAVAPEKDVDCFHPSNVGELTLGSAVLIPATALGVMEILQEYNVPLAGAEAVVVGRSDIVGKPAAALLQQANATVTVCHSRTKDLAAHTLRADVLVVATGLPGTVTADMVKPGAVVIDVGINRTDAGVVGDVDRAVAEVAGMMTPVPGGVGPMTIACLLENAVRCARLRRNG